MKNKKNIIYIVSPVLVAVIMLVAFAISGNITKKADLINPTATTDVSLVNEDNSQVDGNSKVTMLVAGENLIHNTLIYSGEQEDGSLNYDSLYANIKPEIEKFDISVINQETVLGGSSFEYSGYPMFNTPWEVGDAAINAGFDVFNCASEHVMDMGYSGIEQELAFFNQHKDQAVALGIHDSEESYNQITYYEKNGITFAMLNYTFGTNGVELPGDKPWCVDLFEKNKITTDLTEARANADCVIVFAHWGTEYSFEASEYQKEYTKLFSDLGVDMVVGCHPHVIEPVEWVTNDETGKKMLVYYSLGNFVSHQIDVENLLGGLAEVTFEKKDGEVTITTAKLVPVVCHYVKGENGNYQFNVYKLGDYTDELANTHAQSGGTVEYYTELVNDVVDKDFISLN